MVTYTTTETRKIDLESAHNMRHLGGYATNTGGTTSARLLRGDCLEPLREQDAQELIRQGLRTVIDLRNEVEIKKIPSTLSRHPEVNYLNIPLLGDTGGNPPALPEDFTMGMMYVGILDGARAALQKTFWAIAEAAVKPGSLMFHCTAGKDRTGVTAALLLALAGVPDETIIRDYAETGAHLAPVYDMLVENSGVPATLGRVTEELLSARETNIEMMLSHLNTKYGGARAYLSSLCLTTRELDAIYTMMTTNEEATI